MQIIGSENWGWWMDGIAALTWRSHSLICLCEQNQPPSLQSSPSSLFVGIWRCQYHHQIMTISSTSTPHWVFFWKKKIRETDSVANFPNLFALRAIRYLEFEWNSDSECRTRDKLIAELKRKKKLKHIAV